MNSPRILDSQGNPLSVGDQVKTRWGGAEITGWSTFTPNTEGMTVFAKGFEEPEEARYHAKPAGSPDTFTCSDLQIAKPPRQEAATAAPQPEGSSR
jgi:hypothetical protein